jgi:hypothetical protein
MARPRRTGKTATDTTKQPAQSTDELVCPECGKTFTRAASLGAHRNRAHGVAGTSKASSSSRRRPTASANGRRRTTNRARRAMSEGAGSSVDRDALLQALFPNGLPARESVIRAANDWLDQAERLAKL